MAKISQRSEDIPLNCVCQINGKKVSKARGPIFRLVISHLLFLAPMDADATELLGALISLFRLVSTRFETRSPHGKASNLPFNQWAMDFSFINYF